MIHTFTVAPADTKTRLDIFLSQKLPELTRSRIKKIIEEELVSLNNKPAKAGARIKAGDRINIEIPEPSPLKAEKKKSPLIFFTKTDISS